MSLLRSVLLTVVPDFLLPEWVSNAHPLIVHFPIALIFVSVAADALALWLGKRWETGQEVPAASSPAKDLTQRDTVQGPKPAANSSSSGAKAP